MKNTKSSLRRMDAQAPLNPERPKPPPQATPFPAPAFQNVHGMRVKFQPPLDAPESRT